MSCNIAFGSCGSEWLQTEHLIEEIVYVLAVPIFLRSFSPPVWAAWWRNDLQHDFISLTMIVYCRSLKIEQWGHADTTG